MPRGGPRNHPKDCTCGNCPKMGRPKNQPDVGLNEDAVKVGKGFATGVFARIHELKLRAVHEGKAGAEIKSAEDYALEILRPMDDEAVSFFRLLLAYQLGKPVQPVMTADTRETAPELEFGNLRMPAADKPGAAGKPN